MTLKFGGNKCGMRDTASAATNKTGNNLCNFSLTHAKNSAGFSSKQVGENKKAAARLKTQRQLELHSAAKTSLFYW